MAQHDFVINNQGFPSFRSDLNDFLNAVRTSHSGTSLPSGAVAGTIWLDTTNATTPILKYYDGTDNITLATINHSTNTVDFNDSAISTPLTVTGNATAGAELRLPEDTDNGSNYVALKAPDTIASNLTLTLPSADGTNGQALVTNGTGTLSFTTISAGTSWQSVQTTGFTAVSGRGYPCNTTSSAFTVTLPATPSVGNYVQIVDYAGTFATNNITVGRNGSNIFGEAFDFKLKTNGLSVLFVYIDSTQGWILTDSGLKSDASSTGPYSVNFLVVAGGGGGGNEIGAGGGGAGGYRTSTQNVPIGTEITVTVGDGGAGGTSSPERGSSGSNSSISGSGLTTITSNGGGGGGGGDVASPNHNGANGGSGGGGGAESPASTGTGGTGNTPSTSPSQGNNGGTGGTDASTYRNGGGGGGAGAVGANHTSGSGGNGGAGTASSITGSSITYAGGGGGGTNSGSYPAGTGGTGGGGTGGKYTATNQTAGTANTGGGGGGAGGNAGASGGKGVVILSVPTVSYSGTTTGSPTITTSGSNTILQFNGSGSYTA